jgi:hypothetical protein
LIIDEELGLYLEDFSDAVRVEVVLSVEGPFEVDSYRVNRVYEGDKWKNPE